MAEIIGVTFKEGGKVYYFAAGRGNYEVGKGVIVETARGPECGEVVKKGGMDRETEWIFVF